MPKRKDPLTVRDYQAAGVKQLTKAGGAITDVTAFQRACEPLDVHPAPGVNVGARTAKALRKVLDGKPHSKAAYEARNTRVTGAIYKAERVLDDAIRAWVDVEAAEAAIAAHPDTPRDERGFAEHGVGTAHMTVRVLKALRGRT